MPYERPTALAGVEKIARAGRQRRAVMANSGCHGCWQLAVRWGLNGHANAPSRLTAFIPCTCELRPDAPLLALTPKAPSPGAAPLLPRPRPQPQR